MANNVSLNSDTRQFRSMKLYLDSRWVNLRLEIGDQWLPISNRLSAANHTAQLVCEEANRNEQNGISRRIVRGRFEVATRDLKEAPRHGARNIVGEMCFATG